MNSKVLVTPRSLTRQGHPALDQLPKAGFDIVFSSPGVQPSEAELLKLLPDCVGYLAGVEPISAKVLESARKLKAISRNGTGTNGIDRDAAKRLNIRVLTTPGANARGVAELAFGHILSAVRSISFSDACLKREDWQRREGIELAGRTLGLVGCGHIGKLVTRFALAFDMRVLAYDPYPDKSFNPSPAFRFANLEELWKQADIISLHCPPAAGGKPLVDGAALAEMKKGAYLINTARAELMDPNAVKQALEQGQLAGLTLDVFEKEPPQDWSLVKNTRVIATPHVGGYTKESVERAVEQAVDNLIKAIS